MTDNTYVQHTVHTDALATLGTILDADDPNTRDAVHLASYKVRANQDLLPGDHVQIDEEGVFAYRCPEGVGVGIVDPFLPQPGVRKGQFFWLVVYPRQIESLRHVWEHPAFPPSGETQFVLLGQKEAERWLRDFAARSDVPGFEEMIAAVDYDTQYPRFGVDAGGEIPPEFWDHYEAYRGVKVAPGARGEWFSCAC